MQLEGRFYKTNVEAQAAEIKRRREKETEMRLLSCLVVADTNFLHIFACEQGYHGVAVGKAKQAAKGELDKLKLATMTCREAVKEVAKM